MYFSEHGQVSEVELPDASWLSKMSNLDDELRRRFLGEEVSDANTTIYVEDTHGLTCSITFADEPGKMSTLDELAPRSSQPESLCIIRNVTGLTMNGKRINGTNAIDTIPFRVGYVITSRVLVIASPTSPMMFTSPIVKLMP